MKCFIIHDNYTNETSQKEVMQRTTQDRKPYGLILKSQLSTEAILPSNLTDIANRNLAKELKGLDDHRSDETI